MREMRLVLLGLGNVGRALARLLADKRHHLEHRYGLAWRVVGVATGSHGIVFAPDGIDLEAACLTVEGGGDLTALSGAEPMDKVASLLRSSQADLLFENTPVNYATGQPAIDHIRTALGLGMHAITANKGPVVHAYRQFDPPGRGERRALSVRVHRDGRGPISSRCGESLCRPPG